MNIMKARVNEFNGLFFRIRLLCHHMISQKWFDNTVLFFIALNCITLAMERPNIPPISPVSLLVKPFNN